MHTLLTDDPASTSGNAHRASAGPPHHAGAPARARVRAAFARAGRGLQAAAVAPKVFAVRRRHGAPDVTLAFWGGLGDELLLTGVARELRRRGVDRLWVFSERTEVWRGNRDVALALGWDHRYFRWTQLFGWPLFLPHYSTYVASEDRDVSPPRHILTIMCELVGIVGPIARRTYLHLSDEERARGALVPNQIAIQSGGMTARHPMRTKQWFPERYQAVVDALKHDVNFVQLGAPSDPPLEGALDLRGRTSLRESAAVLANSLAFVGQVGMLMHLARAVECRAVVVYGGRERPDQTGYACNENLYAPVPCAPCWKLNTCGYDMRCMREITAAEVVRAVRRQLARRGEPLPVDTDFIPVDAFPARDTRDGRVLLTITQPNGVQREVDARFPPPDAAAPRRGPTSAAA